MKKLKHIKIFEQFLNEGVDADAKISSSKNQNAFKVGTDIRIQVKDGKLFKDNNGIYFESFWGNDTSSAKKDKTLYNGKLYITQNGENYIIFDEIKSIMATINKGEYSGLIDMYNNFVNKKQ